MNAFQLSILALLLGGCGTEDSGKNDPVSSDDPVEPTDDTGAPEDTGEPEIELDDCERLGLEAVAFNTDGDSLPLRHKVAPDFTLPLVDGSNWTFSEQFSGCESYIFLPHWLPVDDLDNRSWWDEGMAGLIENSPTNVHYFFVVGGSPDDADSRIDAMATEVGETLASMSDDDGAWWADRLHVVAQPSNLFDGIISMGFSGNIGTYGLAIDRFQKFRTLGSMAAVQEYDAALADAGMWPYERRLYEAGYQPQYYNFEFDRQTRIDAETATVVEVLNGGVVAQYEDGILTIPDNLDDFDTLEIDVVMECPNTNAYELGNCGPWDYLAHMWLQVDVLTDPPPEPEPEPEDTGSEDTGSEDTGDEDAEDTGESPPPEPILTTQWWEMARFITTYHRESRWVVDASHALPWLQAGAEHTVRYEWAPSWNTQPTAVTTRFRFSNRAKETRASETVHLFSGGGLNTSYNDREPVEVDIPADVTRVELVAITTGHGMATSNCAEFCDHSHHFSINGTENVQNLDDPGLMSGCADKVSEGVVPNQAGTWWFGRGGWCPGQEVEPFVVDVTDQLTIGDTATVSYEAKINGSAPFDNAGNINLNTWLVFHR